MRDLLSPGSLAILLTALSACDGAGAGVEPGRDALEMCDVRGAHAIYEDAHAAHPDDPDAALGFALTESLLIGEDPEAVAGLALMGFRGGIDSEMLLWGPPGLLGSLNRHVSSYAYADHVEARFPYEPVRSPTDDWDLVSPSTRAHEVVERAWAMQERFARISAAFETAARGAPLTIGFGGHCGVGDVELSAAELYLAAAGWRGVVLALQLSRGYSWDFPIRDAFAVGDGTRLDLLTRQADVLNTHLGAIADASALGAARDEWRHFFALLKAAVESANAADPVGPDGLVDWSAYRAGLLEAMLVQGAAAEQLADGRVVAPGLTPTWSGDLAPLFDGELDLAAFGRSWTVREDPMWGDVWLEMDEAPIDQVFLAVLSLSPLGDTIGEVQWSHIDDWRGSRAEWQITEVPSTRPGVRPLELPRFISPAVERYRDVWYFE